MTQPVEFPSALPVYQDVGLQAPYVEFTVRLAWALHRYGAPAHRLEEVAQLMSERLGLPGQFLSMPTAFIAAFGPWRAQRLFLVRIDPGEVDLQKQVQLDGVAEQVAEGRLNPLTGVQKIDAIMASPPRYGNALTVSCFGVASSAASRFFGGGWREIAVSGGIGLFVGALSLLMGKRRSTARVFEPVAAVAASVLAALAAWRLGSLSTSIAVLGGL
ncbi:MAG: threonine/serine exporter family protein, partial [Polyangiaceae bacterium]|nr:threonine/serine exporter family protein [Polyangiaceae bacterium]